MTVNQETPDARCTLANQSASRMSVAPSSEAAPARPSPTRLPRIPPAPAGRTPAEKCRAASPQLDASAPTRPDTRSAIVERPWPGAPGTRFNPLQAPNPIATGNRKAGQPKNR